MHKDKKAWLQSRLLSCQKTNPEYRGCAAVGGFAALRMRRNPLRVSGAGFRGSCEGRDVRSDVEHLNTTDAGFHIYIQSQIEAQRSGFDLERRSRKMSAL